MKNNKSNKKRSLNKKSNCKDYELNNPFFYEESISLDSIISSERKWKELIEGELLC